MIRLFSKVCEIFITITIVLMVNSICIVCKAQDKFGDGLSSLKQKHEKLAEDSSRVIALMNIASSFGVQRPDSAIFYNLKALSLARKIGYQSGELGALVGTEVTLQNNGNIVKAYSIAFKGLKLARAYKDPFYLAIFLCDLGIINGELGNFTTALELLRQSRHLFDSLKNTAFAIYPWSNIGNIYLKQGNLDSALFYCRAAFAAQTMDFHWVDYYSCLNLGKVYLQKKEYAHALFYFKYSLSKAAYFSHKFNSNLFVAMAYQSLNRKDSCLLYGNKAMGIARESNIFSQLIEANSFFASLYQKEDPERALQFALNALAYKDSLNRFAEALIVESFNEFDEQERQLEIKNAQAAYRYQTQQYALVAGLAAVLLIAAILFHNNKQKQIANRLLSLQKEEINIQRQKAEEAEKLKSRFFANISHEFRTPLTLIQGPVQEMLEDFADHPKVKERMKLVQRNGDLVLKLINQLLDLAKLESGTLEVEKSENDLNAFLTVVTNSFSSLAFQKNVTLETELPTTRHQVSFDKGKVETILINLINNAIKFTPSGGKVNIGAFLQTTINQSQHELLLVVSDTGIGIQKEQHDKIFERFHQVSEAHNEVGTGIGLSLVKELVSLMKGTLSLVSEPGKGSEFTVAIPVEVIRIVNEEEGVERIEEQQESLEYSLKGSVSDPHDNKPRILVVEDNSDLRKFIIGSLGQEFHFLEGADGKQGLEIALEETPDLIISDVMMPEMDGITMTGKLKVDTRTSHIPLILLTARTSDESKLMGLGTGADDYLTKPFNKNELLLKVRNSIALRVKLREKLKLELLKESPNVEVQSADEKFLLKVRDAILSRLSDEQLSVESLADEIGLSRSQLFRKISALTGTSVNELIRTFRLQRAAQLIEQNWGPVTQVAYEVGFSNLSYFSKAFKEKYGVLPSEYTAKLQ